MPQGFSQLTRRTFISWLLRLLGIGLLIVLLTRLNLGRVLETLQQANFFLVMLAVLAVIPLIWLKTLRWQGLLRSQAVEFPIRPALLAYFGSLFIGFLTPGRLGEFVKAIHVSRDCEVPAAQAFSSVLGDRLFDLYTLLVVGGAALLNSTVGITEALELVASIVLLSLPLVVFLNNATFGLIQRFGLKLGSFGRKLFAPGGWLVEMRQSLRQTKSWALVAAALTILAYAVFFGQCYLLALALGIPVGPIHISCAVALGSLVTLLPVSISGLGTREAVIVVYLNALGVTEEKALAFSLLVFVTFYIAGGLMGAVAWCMKPIPLAGGSRSAFNQS